MTETELAVIGDRHAPQPPRPCSCGGVNTEVELRQCPRHGPGRRVGEDIDALVAECRRLGDLVGTYRALCATPPRDEIARQREHVDAALARVRQLEDQVSALAIANAELGLRVLDQLLGEDEGLDLDLLRKLASGEGGTRTGALKRAGLLEWTVTPRGYARLLEKSGATLGARPAEREETP